MLRVLEPTCMVVAVVVRLPEHCISFVHGTTRVVAQVSTGIRVAPAGLHTLPSPRLVFVIWVVFLVLHPEPLGLLHERPLLAFTQQAAENTQQGKDGHGAPSLLRTQAHTLLPGVRQSEPSIRCRRVQDTLQGVTCPPAENSGTSGGRAQQACVVKTMCSL